MKASDLFIQALENEKVEYIFGVPGEENLDLLNSLKNSRIKFITTRHEQAAGFMAATYGRLTGNPGVCLSTVGPGATNLMTAAAYAQLGAMPMLMITGQKPILQSKQGSFQIVNTVEMMESITKYNKQILGADLIPAHIREAMREASAERPGAVHLELPEDIAAQDTQATVMPISYPRRPAGEEKAIKLAVEMIESAKSPLLLIGAGANRQRTSKMLLEFIKKTGIPFFNTQMGKGVLDEHCPEYLGTAALSAGDYIHCAINRADLIINVGHDTIEKPPFFMEVGSSKVLHINFFPATVDPIYFPQHEVIGDIANSVWQISEKITRKANWDFKYYNKLKNSTIKHINDRADSSAFPVLPQRLVREVRKVMPRNKSIVALDNGMYKLWFARNYPAYGRNSLLLDNALATMGAGLPSAIAAKLITPDKKVLAVVGDGGFMMNSQELETAVRLKLDLVILVVNDNGFGMIKWKQAAKGFENFGLEYKNPDFVKYAESYGVQGVRVEDTNDLGRILEERVNSKGVHLIEVPIDYRENKRVFDQELKALTCDL